MQMSQSPRVARVESRPIGHWLEFGQAFGQFGLRYWAKESFEYVHFDTRQYNHIAWDTLATLRKLLTARIGAVIGDGPLKPA
jgi:hypothetical protein